MPRSRSYKASGVRHGVQTRKTVRAVVALTLLCLTAMAIIAEYMLRGQANARQDEARSNAIGSQYDVLADGSVVFAKDGTIDRALADWLDTNDGEPRTFEVGPDQFVGQAIIPRGSTMAHLPNLIRMLQANPAITMMIFGYATSSDKADEITISTGRAKWLYDYLIRADVEASRLSYAGLGSGVDVEGENRRSIGRVTLRFDPKGKKNKQSSGASQ